MFVVFLVCLSKDLFWHVSFVLLDLIDDHYVTALRLFGMWSERTYSYRLKLPLKVALLGFNMN